MANKVLKKRKEKKKKKKEKKRKEKFFMSEQWKKKPRREKRAGIVVANECPVETGRQVGSRVRENRQSEFKIYDRHEGVVVSKQRREKQKGQAL